MREGCKHVYGSFRKNRKGRKERGWSINNLAMEALLTQSTLNNLYARKAEPKLSTLRAILQCFRHFSGGVFRRRRRRKKGGNFKLVSYTHMTLPTSDLV